jgi:hypothetical protein
MGYKALILLKRDKTEGLKALDQYIDAYAQRDPLASIADVENMWTSRHIDMNLLGHLIENQVSWYEGEVKQYLSTGTGYYDGKSTTSGPSRLRGGTLSPP